MQQEAELKSRKLKKIFAKLTAMKQEIIDLREAHNRDCREMETTQESLVKELKLKIMIIDNFVPPEDKQWMLNNSRYDENVEEYVLPPPTIEKITHRPIAHSHLDQPCSEYALHKMRLYDCAHRYKSENILNLSLDMPQKTTSNYRRPDVSPALRAVLDAAMQVESDLEIDDEHGNGKGTGSARTQAQMDTIAHNLAMKKETQRARTARPKYASNRPSSKINKIGSGLASASTSKYRQEERERYYK